MSSECLREPPESPGPPPTPEAAGRATLPRGERARGALLRYAIAVAAVACIFGCKWFLDSILSDEPPFVLFIVAVVVAAWYGGWGPGLLASVLCALLGGYFFLSPEYFLWKPVRWQNLGPLLFVAEGVFVTHLLERLKAARRQTAENDELFRLLLDGARDYAFFLLDPAGRVVRWSPGARRIVGFITDEILGRHFACFYPDEEVRRGKPAQDLRAAGAGRFEEEGWRVRRDGSHFWADVVIAALHDPAGELRGFSVLARDATERRRTEEALRESEARLRTIVTTAADAIITFDRDGVVQSVNPAAERIFGYAAGEAVGRDVARLMPGPFADDHDGRSGEFPLGVEGRLPDAAGREVVGRRKDGTPFPVELAVGAVGGRGLFTAIARDVTRRKELEREVLEVAAQEQRRIGQELHDGVGQELTGLGLMAEALADRLRPASPAEAALAGRIGTGLERARQQVRLLSQGLVPVEVDAEGLRSALEELAARTREQSGVACAFECVGPGRVTDTAAATHLFRIAQEAIHNALRHGRARHIRVTLRDEPGLLTLGVRDDGVGIGPRPGDGKGLGIRTMQYRARMVGGVLRVRPADGGGTLVSCTLARGQGSE